MPEETNRLTDQISDYLFAPTRTAVGNLKREAVSGKISCTGDLSVEIVSEAIRIASMKSQILKEFLALKPKSYNLFTMHRAENTDFHENMVSVIRSFQILATSESKKDETGGNVIIFPIHPRTERLLKEKNLYRRLLRCKNVRVIEPVGYLDFIKLIANQQKL